MLYIGIDLGTSAVKLLLMNSEGEIVKIVSKEYGLSFPHPGWSEQDPEDWYTQSIAGVKDLLEGQDKDQVAGISFGGQMHGLVMLDRDDQVIRPAILWNDGRTTEETDYLNHVIGREKLEQYTSNIAFAGFTAPKILWVKKHEPENFSRCVKIMLPKDYLAYRLTGVFSTDYSDASGMLLLDVAHKCWSEEMCGICGITVDMLPKLYESYEKTGFVKHEIAEELGISDSVVVAAGAGDNAASAVGTGTVGEGKCNISLGTSGTLFISADHYVSMRGQNAVHDFAHADGNFHLMGCMLSAASCNKWWTEEILHTKDYPAEQKDITDDMLGENHVFYLPYLMGERSPLNDPLARSTFIGMTMDTTRADMTQAMLEGVAFGLRDSLEIARKLGISVTKSTIVGGGSRSPLWRKIVGNVCNLTLEIPESVEGPSMGGAMLAAVACGEYPDVKTACEKIIRITKTEEPDPELVAKYEKKYQEFRRIYPALKEVFPKLQ